MPDPLTDKQGGFVRRHLGIHVPRSKAAQGQFVAFMTARLLWDDTRQSVQSQLRKLESAIREATKDQPYAEEAARNTPLLYEMLETFDTRLSDKLDEALNSAAPEDRSRRHKEAKGILAEYITYLKSEPIFAELDENPFVPVTIRRLTPSHSVIDGAKLLVRRWRGHGCHAGCP